jgi:hypothetical protein
VALTPEQIAAEQKRILESMGKRRTRTHSHKRGTMNGLEAAFAERLEGLRVAGDLRAWEFEPVALLLAPKLRYTPDFFCWWADGHIECAEVKGFWRDDARAKVKMAAALYPQFWFVGWKHVNGKWIAEEF